MFEFDSFFVMFEIMFFLVFIIIALSIIKGIMQWNKNNHSPRLTVQAKVVSKQMNVSHHHHHHDQGMHTTTSTTYYVTFEVESGDRMVLQLNRLDYGMLAEGDVGKLTFQGTRYLGFEREY